jgi:hypothetical protein
MIVSQLLEIYVWSFYICVLIDENTGHVSEWTRRKGKDYHQNRIDAYSEDSFISCQLYWLYVILFEQVLFVGISESIENNRNYHHEISNYLKILHMSGST